MLVYDITDKDSYNFLQEKIEIPHSKRIFLVGNKIDKESKREVSFEEGKSYSL